jgi:hypothetical protein
VSKRGQKQVPRFALDRGSNLGLTGYNKRMFLEVIPDVTSNPQFFFFPALY